MKTGFVWLLLAMSTTGWALTPDRPLQGTGTVYRVIDGDTYIVNITEKSVFEDLYRRADTKQRKHLNPQFQSFRIRLASVDTPESVHVDPRRNTPEGKAISSAMKARLEGQVVAFTCFDFGYYGRAICNVAHGGDDIGLLLITRGDSDYVTRYGRNPFLDEQYRKAMASRRN